MSSSSTTTRTNRLPSSTPSTSRTSGSGSGSGSNHHHQNQPLHLHTSNTQGENEHFQYQRQGQQRQHHQQQLQHLDPLRRLSQQDESGQNCSSQYHETADIDDHSSNDGNSNSNSNNHATLQPSNSTAGCSHSTAGSITTTTTTTTTAQLQTRFSFYNAQDFALTGTPTLSPTAQTATAIATATTTTTTAAATTGATEDKATASADLRAKSTAVKTTTSTTAKGFNVMLSTSSSAESVMSNANANARTPLPLPVTNSPPLRYNFYNADEVNSAAEPPSNRRSINNNIRLDPRASAGERTQQSQQRHSSTTNDTASHAATIAELLAPPNLTTTTATRRSSASPSSGHATTTTTTTRMDSADILRSLQKHEQQRLDILQQHHPQHAAQQHALPQVPTSGPPQYSNSYYYPRPSNPYEEAIRDAIDLLRKHRLPPAETAIETTTTATPWTTSSQSQPPSGNNRQRPTPTIDTATLAELDGVASDMHNHDDNPYNVPLPQDPWRVHAPPYPPHMRTHVDHDDTAIDQQHRQDQDDDRKNWKHHQLRRSFQHAWSLESPPGATAASASPGAVTASSAMVPRTPAEDDPVLQLRLGWRTPSGGANALDEHNINSSSNSTSSLLLVGDAYQAEIEARRKQRQERMAKYASRLAELKQQEDFEPSEDTHNGGDGQQEQHHPFTQHYDDHRGQQQPQPAIPQDLYATWPMHEYPSTSAADNGVLQPSLSVASSSSLLLDVHMMTIPAVTSSLSAMSASHASSGLPHQQQPQYSNKNNISGEHMPNPPDRCAAVADVMSSMPATTGAATNPVEAAAVQRGVERVLMAILERAYSSTSHSHSSSRGHAGDGSSVAETAELQSHQPSVEHAGNYHHKHQQMFLLESKEEKKSDRYFSSQSGATSQHQRTNSHNTDQHQSIYQASMQPQARNQPGTISSSTSSSALPPQPDHEQDALVLAVSDLLLTGAGSGAAASYNWKSSSYPCSASPDKAIDRDRPGLLNPPQRPQQQVQQQPEIDPTITDERALRSVLSDPYPRSPADKNPRGFGRSPNYGPVDVEIDDGDDGGVRSDPGASAQAHAELDALVHKVFRGAGAVDTTTATTTTTTTLASHKSRGNRSNKSKNRPIHRYLLNLAPAIDDALNPSLRFNDSIPVGEPHEGSLADQESSKDDEDEIDVRVRRILEDNEEGYDEDAVEETEDEFDDNEGDDEEGDAPDFDDEESIDRSSSGDPFAAPDDSVADEDEDTTHMGSRTLDAVLGPLSKKAGGKTGVVLESSSTPPPPKTVTSPSLLQSLSAAIDLVVGVKSNEDSRPTSDKYAAADYRESGGGGTDESVSSDTTDSEAADLMLTLCAHLLPPPAVRSRGAGGRLLDTVPGWDETNPDEPGYRIVRLSSSQLRRVEREYEHFTECIRRGSVGEGPVLKKQLDSANDVGDSFDTFERDLQEAEDLIDRDERRHSKMGSGAARSSSLHHGNDKDATAATSSSSSGASPAEGDNKDEGCSLPNFPGVKATGRGEMGDLEFFYLPIIFKSHVTGFEPTKDLYLEAGNVVAGQYLVEGEMGSAAFSTAYRCVDLNSAGDGPDGHEEVCLKVIKNTKDFFDQSLDEIKILELLRQTGKCHENHILEMKTFFYHREHLIIVTELLRQNLFEFGKFIIDNNEKPYFTLPRLSYITRQCLIALNFTHQMALVHSDVKPENILIASYSRAQVKVIDFGSSCFLTDRQSSYIQSRSYRAPEVVLGLPYDGRIDVWSLGCVVAEMYTGEVTFQNDSVVSMLSRIEAICGVFPKHMIAQGRQSSRFFTKSGLLYERVEQRDESQRQSYSEDSSDDDDRQRQQSTIDIFQPKRTTLSERLGIPPTLINRLDAGLSLSREERRQAQFVDFVRSLLTIDPDVRPTAAEALEHPWIQYAATLTEDDIKYPSS